MQGVATAKGTVAFGSSSLGTLTKAGIGARRLWTLNCRVSD